MLITIVIIVISLYYNSKNKGKLIEEFWENGSIKHKYYFRNEIGKCGQEIFFYRNGKVNRKNQWRNNNLNGPTIVFYSTGEKYIASNYKDGKLEGKYTVFSKSGQILREYLYNDGVKISEVINIRKVDLKSKLSTIGEFPLESNDEKNIYENAKSNYEFIKSLEETKDNDKNEVGFFIRTKESK